MASTSMISSAVLSAAVLFAFAVGSVLASSEGFLGGRLGAGLRSSTEDFQAAMDTLMGCGGSVDRERLSAVEQAIKPMWRVLPKNQHDLIEWRMVRYLAHRYFLQQSSLLIRGFEPMHQLNASYSGIAEIINDHVPSLVNAALEGKRSSKGFSLDEVVAMVATLGQLISDSESTLLATVYKQQRKSTTQSLSHIELSKIMEAYMVHYMLGEDQGAARLVLRNRTLLETAFPKWHEVNHFLNGVVKSMEFARQRAPQPGHAQVALTGQYSFDDAHEVASGITTKFASFWESECQLIKQSLVDLDKTGSGRVSLSDFYGANADGEWRFGESEAYLRELGALDESSSWRGKQVIIPNYLQGASNCIVTTPHYLVCCVNECESVLNDVEDAVGAAVAQPEIILNLVGNMSDFDDEPTKLDASLKAQLLRIAETHGGKVPLHGRLFAQWLHYVFPRECPFPHRSGTHSALTPTQFGGDFVASDEEVRSHAATRDENENATLLSDLEETQWMSQWSEEEELIADYSLQLRAPWGTGHSLFLLGLVAAVLSAVGWTVSAGKDASTLPFGGAIERKAHFV